MKNTFTKTSKSIVKKTTKAMKKNPVATVAVGGGIITAALGSGIATAMQMVKIKKLEKQLAEKAEKTTEAKPEENKPEAEVVEGEVVEETGAEEEKK